MNCYASTYISGLNKAVENWLRQDHKTCKILFNLDGLIVYEALEPVFANYFNNTYLVLSFTKSSTIDFNKAIKTFLEKTKVNFNSNQFSQFKNKKFKILTVDKNVPTSVDYSLLKPLENEIIKTTKMILGMR